MCELGGLRESSKESGREGREEGKRLEGNVVRMEGSKGNN